MKKENSTYNVKNRNGIDAHLHHSQVIVEDADGRHCGDDEIILTIPGYEDYDTDLIQGDTVMLHFSKAEARRLSRILWQMATRLMTADERELEDISDRPLVDDEELLKAIGYGNEKSAE